jgi:hypothetical protein
MRYVIVRAARRLFPISVKYPVAGPMCRAFGLIARIG